MAQQPVLLQPRRRKEKQTVTFTQQELQILSSHLKVSMRAFDGIQKKYAHLAKLAWDESDKTRKDDPAVAEAFMMFSVANARKNRIREKNKRLAALQTKVKKMLKT